MALPLLAILSATTNVFTLRALAKAGLTRVTLKTGAIRYKDIATGRFVSQSVAKTRVAASRTTVRQMAGNVAATISTLGLASLGFLRTGAIVGSAVLSKVIPAAAAILGSLDKSSDNVKNRIDDSQNIESGEISDRDLINPMIEQLSTLNPPDIFSPDSSVISNESDDITPESINKILKRIGLLENHQKETSIYLNKMQSIFNRSNIFEKRIKDLEDREKKEDTVEKKKSNKLLLALGAGIAANALGLFDRLKATLPELIMMATLKVYEYIDEIKSKFTEIFESFTESISAITDSIDSIFEFINEKFETVDNFIDSFLPEKGFFEDEIESFVNSKFMRNLESIMNPRGEYDNDLSSFYDPFTGKTFTTNQTSTTDVPNSENVLANYDAYIRLKRILPARATQIANDFYEKHGITIEQAYNEAATSPLILRPEYLEKIDENIEPFNPFIQSDSLLQQSDDMDSLLLPSEEKTNTVMPLIFPINQRQQIRQNIMDMGTSTMSATSSYRPSDSYL